MLFPINLPSNWLSKDGNTLAIAENAAFVFF